jgi:tetratricopeptide (TPR) repeat protein
MRKLSFVVAITGCCMLLLAGCNIIESLKNAEHKPNPEAEKWLQTGIDYYDKGDMEKAEESFSLAIEKDPDFADAYRWKGKALDRSSPSDNQKLLVLYYYDTAIQLNPQDEQNYFERGAYFYGSEMYSPALEDFNKGIRLSQDDYQAYVCRGLTNLELERFEDSIMDFSRALEINPDFTMGYLLRGGAYLKLEDYDQAIADITEFIETGPLDVRAFIFRAAAYSYRADYLSALSDLNAAISLEPDLPKSYSLRADILVKLGNRVEAEKDYRKACEMGYEIACEELKMILEDRGH